MKIGRFIASHYLIGQCYRNSYHSCREFHVLKFLFLAIVFCVTCQTLISALFPNSLGYFLFIIQL